MIFERSTGSLRSSAESTTRGPSLRSAAVFTNLTRDHLDYHGTLERYFGVKMRLFTGDAGAPPKVAVVNLDDPYGAGAPAAYLNRAAFTSPTAGTYSTLTPFTIVNPNNLQNDFALTIYRHRIDGTTAKTRRSP